MYNLLNCGSRRDELLTSQYTINTEIYNISMTVNRERTGYSHGYMLAYNTQSLYSST